jgi:hypothetical protein
MSGAPLAPGKLDAFARLPRGQLHSEGSVEHTAQTSTFPLLPDSLSQVVGSWSRTTDMKFVETILCDLLGHL